MARDQSSTSVTYRLRSGELATVDRRCQVRQGRRRQSPSRPRPKPGSDAAHVSAALHPDQLQRCVCRRPARRSFDTPTACGAGPHRHATRNHSFQRSTGRTRRRRPVESALGSRSRCHAEGRKDPGRHPGLITDRSVPRGAKYPRGTGTLPSAIAACRHGSCSVPSLQPRAPEGADTAAYWLPPRTPGASSPRVRRAVRRFPTSSRITSNPWQTASTIPRPC